MGYEVRPGVDDVRTDTVQVVILNDPDKMRAFCRAVQQASPIDAIVTPEPGDLPGYADPVIMAAGTFVQGGSLEFSADGPMRPPYAVFLQGGTSKEHIFIALEEVVTALEQL